MKQPKKNSFQVSNEKEKSWYYDEFGNKIMKYAYFSIIITIDDKEKRIIRKVDSYNHIRGFLCGYLQALLDKGVNVKNAEVEIYLNSNDDFASEVMPAQDVLNEVLS